MLKVLVGCKVDLQHERQVSKEEGIKKAKEIGISFYETSALTNEGVHVLFKDIGEILVKAKPEAPKEEELPEKIAIQKRSLGISSGCPCQ